MFKATFEGKLGSLVMCLQIIFKFQSNGPFGPVLLNTMGLRETGPQFTFLSLDFLLSKYPYLTREQVW